MLHYFFNFLNNSSFFPFYIVTPCPYAIGTAVENLRVAKLRSIEKKKFLLIFVPKKLSAILRYNICNNYLFDKVFVKEQDEKKYKLEKKIIFFILFCFFFLRRTLALTFLKVFKIKLPENFFFLEIGIRDDDLNIKKDLDNIPPYDFSRIGSIEIEKIKIKLSENILQSLKIDKDQEFICLHVRDGEYRQDFQRREERNSSIENYYELINYLLKKNIIIFRLGIKARKKIELKNKYIIDMPFLDINYDYFNIYLLKNCKFFIGTQSGMHQLAFLFEKNCLITNIVRIFEDIPLTTKCRSISKIPYFRDKKNILSIKQYLDLPYAYHHQHFINNELGYLENSKEDLYLAVKEFYQLTTTKKFSNPILDNNQKNFNELLLSKFMLYLKNDKDLINHCNKIYLLKKLKSIKGSFSSFFLNKYFN